MFTHNVVFVVASVAVWMTLAAWNVSVFVRWSQIRNLAGIWEIPRGSNFQWLDRQIISIGAVTWSYRVRGISLMHCDTVKCSLDGPFSFLFYTLISLHFITNLIIYFVLRLLLHIDYVSMTRLRCNVMKFIYIFFFVPITSRYKYDTVRIQIRLS